MNTSNCGLEKCRETVGDGPQCSLCKKVFHYKCAGYTERRFIKLGTSRSSWKCDLCLREEKSDNNTEEAVSPNVVESFSPRQAPTEKDSNVESHSKDSLTTISSKLNMVNGNGKTFRNNFNTQ